MKKINVFTAFSGYDSQCLALQRIKEKHTDFDFDLVGWSEIDKYAIKAHNALFPQWEDRNFGDISKIDWNLVPDIDLFTYSSPCFVGDTMVYTSKGYKQIKNIRVGDMVLTKEGYYKPCTAIGSDGYKPIFRLNAQGILPIRCTANHPFWVKSRVKYWDNSIRKYCYKFEEPCKKRYDELRVNDDFIGIPIIKEENNSGYDSSSLWLLGRYVADGHIDTQGNIVFSIGESKADDFISHTNELYRMYNHTKSCKRFIFNRRCDIASLVKLADVGSRAIHKRFSPFILSLTKEELKQVIDGYVSGDGCFLKKSNMYSATTISKELALSLVLAIQKAYNVGCGIYYDKRPEKYIIEGRVVNQHDTYIVRWSPDRKKKHYIVEENMIWYPIRGKEDTHLQERIYNITVDESHTYTANNCSVGNCQDFSNAGLQRGGEEGSGTRSSLLWECRKAIETKKPKYLFLENVKALVSKKFLPLFLSWCEVLKSLGYKNYWQVLNAKDYGVPQNRERVFLVSILNSEEPYQFPLPFPLEKRLIDVVEKKVDEKYYLSEEAVSKFQSVDD